METPAQSYARNDPWLAGAMRKCRELRRRHKKLIRRCSMARAEAEDPANGWKNPGERHEDVNELAKLIQKIAVRVLCIDDQIHARLEEHRAGRR